LPHVVMQLARFHIIFTFLMLLLLASCFHLAYRLTHVLPALSMQSTFMLQLKQRPTVWLLRITLSSTSFPIFDICKSANVVPMSLSELSSTFSVSISQLPVAFAFQHLFFESPRFSSRVELSAQPRTATSSTREKHFPHRLPSRFTQLFKLREPGLGLFSSELIPSLSLHHPQSAVITSDYRASIRSAPHKACVTQIENCLTEIWALSLYRLANRTFRRRPFLPLNVFSSKPFRRGSQVDRSRIRRPRLRRVFESSESRQDQITTVVYLLGLNSYHSPSKAPKNQNSAHARRHRSFEFSGS
jgi:hypothetical protein